MCRGCEFDRYAYMCQVLRARVIHPFQSTSASAIAACRLPASFLLSIRQRSTKCSCWRCAGAGGGDSDVYPSADRSALCTWCPPQITPHPMVGPYICMWCTCMPDPNHTQSELSSEFLATVRRKLSHELISVATAVAWVA